MGCLLTALSFYLKVTFDILFIYNIFFVIHFVMNIFQSLINYNVQLYNVFILFYQTYEIGLSAVPALAVTGILVTLN